jgi:hypothetical protein
MKTTFNRSIKYGFVKYTIPSNLQRLEKRWEN